MHRIRIDLYNAWLLLRLGRSSFSGARRLPPTCWVRYWRPRGGIPLSSAPLVGLHGVYARPPVRIVQQRSL